MGRPAAKELTRRELDVMHIFWTQGELSAQGARDALARGGEDLAYVTVANLVRLLVDKGFLEAANAERPFLYRPIRSFEEVSRSLVGELVERVFRGSREQLLTQVFGGRKRLTAKERTLLERILKEQDR